MWEAGDLGLIKLSGAIKSKRGFIGGGNRMRKVNGDQSHLWTGGKAMRMHDKVLKPFEEIKQRQTHVFGIFWVGHEYDAKNNDQEK